MSDILTARWSIVSAAGSSEESRKMALVWLCEAYWHPSYEYVGRQGFDAAAAGDLT